MLLVGLAIVLILPGPFVPIADHLLDTVPEARRAFSSGQMLLSYQWRNLLILSLMLTASGVVLYFSRQPIYLPLRVPMFHTLVGVVAAADLLRFGWGFHPAADPAWLEFTPPAIEFLKERAAGGGPWRLTTLQVEGGHQTLNANIPWLHSLQDVRGYDSIIPRQYVEFMTSLEGQGELLFNRIAPLYGVESLSSPLLDLLNVRYVVTEGRISNPDYELVYEGEVRVYENIDTLPRAFALPHGEAVSEADLPARLRTLDPRQVILLDTVAVSNPESEWPLQPAQVVSYTLNTVLVDVVLPGPGWLVLADSYFPGWRAYRSDPQDEMASEVELEILRANGNFRAVWLGAGAHRVRFQYAPTSLKIGLYASLAAIVVISLLALYRLRGCTS